MDDKQLLRYSRQIMLPEIDISGQERIKKSKVLLVGLDGLGSPISIYLAFLRLGKLPFKERKLFVDSAGAR